MNISKTPLLIVDVQNGFVNEKSKHVLPLIRKLAAAWMSEGGPIFMSQFTNEPHSQWERLIGWRRLRDEREIAIHADLAPVADYAVTFRKRTYTCLTGPFKAAVDTSDWSEVALCGIATDGCVLATAVDLFQNPERPLRPIVISDACASHAGERVHEAGLLLLERFIGRDQLLDSNDVLGSTNGRSPKS